MGRIRKPHKVKLVIGILSNNMGAMGRASAALKRMYGPVDLESPLMDFDHTRYYACEMGEGLKRKFMSFARPVDPARIGRVKISTNRLETMLSEGGRRTVNIDPGYLDCAKLVLLSTKDHAHRIYLGAGIFAEVTLFYRDGGFHAWPWTYPDYRTAPYRAVFKAIRDLYTKG